MTKTIYILRHGQTQDDLEDRFEGWHDDDLTEKGAQDCHETLRLLRTLKIKRLITSPLKRAMQVGSIIGEGLRLEPEIRSEWKERNHYGILTGMVKSEAMKQYPEIVAQVHDPDGHVPGREPKEDFIARITTALRRSLAEDEETVLAVSHGGIMRRLLEHFFSAPRLVETEDYCLIRLDHDAETLLFSESWGITFSAPFSAPVRIPFPCITKPPSVSRST